MFLNHDDQVRAKAAPWLSGVEIAAFKRLNGGVRQFASVEWKTLSENDMGEIRPLLALRMEQAQVLMDDLWNAGVRPTEGAGSAGSMRAAQDHIKDLRRVAFKALGIES